MSDPASDLHYRRETKTTKTLYNITPSVKEKQRKYQFILSLSIRNSSVIIFLHIITSSYSLHSATLVTRPTFPLDLQGQH
jgi:hypothetical protein